MTPVRRRPIWRVATIVPAVASTLAGLAVVAVVTGSVGSPQAASFADRSPLAALEHFYQVPGGAMAAGWDFDPDAKTTPLTTYATVDHKLVKSATANLVRPDIGKLHPNAGPDHGFKFFVPVPQGKHIVCISATNIGKGTDYHFGCVTHDFEYGPFGTIDALTASHGAIHVKGWAIDNDAVSKPLTATITIDKTAHTLLADQPRADLANVSRGAGPNHQFGADYPVAQGTHTACVTITNVGWGNNTNLGCRTLTLDDSPQGRLDIAGQRSGELHVAGWTYDPDEPTTPLTVTVEVDGHSHTITANTKRTDVGAKFPGVGNSHGFDVSYSLAEGRHTVCVSAHNVSFGSTSSLGCRTVTLNFTPAASLTDLTATSTGIDVSGWASDPDTSAAISADIDIDGHLKTVLKAAGAASGHTGHGFSAAIPLTSGRHTVCAVGLNVLYGTHNSPSSCKTITLALKPIGRFDSLARASGSTNLAITGWTIDPDTKSPLGVTVTLDGKADGTVTASVARPDVEKVYPTWGVDHGFANTLTAGDGEHTVCLTAKNVGGGSDDSLGCRLIDAVHPVAPNAPRSVTAQTGYGGAVVTWSAPTSDGGAPWSQYIVTASPGGASVTVGPTGTSATILGLTPGKTYTFSVSAKNVAGTSVATVSPAVTTQASPPPQTSPAPVSTSRYIRNIRGASTSELSTMRAEGKADAVANPSGHGYLILLDIGGQDQSDGGVVLSATTRFVPYSDLVKDLEAYVDGYHSGQRASAPITIAIGTNNDMDVTTTSGKAWASTVVAPVASYAKRYAGMVVAGADDIEPGFRATYTATKSWLSGYLSATSAPFVFNGSADGCAWTVTNRGCNNGWTMSDLYYLAAGAAPTRLLNLPQIYNTTMAAQWKYISLTGVGQREPRINFAGTLTEWTACDQTNSCGSLTGHTAWSQMWSDLQSDSRLKVASLPYSTDLRIDS